MDAIGLLQQVSKRDQVGGRIVEVLDEAAQLLGPGADSLEDELVEACGDGPRGIEKPCRHIIEAGGKRLRPILCLLAFRAARGGNPLPLDLAVTCELLHNATLLHDDVIDEGELRRGRETARVIYGNAISILGGDFLLVKTVETVAHRGSHYMEPFVWTLRQLIKGELVQLQRRGSVDTTRDEYFRIIEGKTASLFRWAANSGSLAAGAEERACRELGRFGWHVGLAFQLMDDLLDFDGDGQTLGKSLLADISEGTMTLPIILAGMKSPELYKLLDKLSSNGDAAKVAPLVSKIVHATGAADETKALAREHTRQGLEALRAVHDSLDPDVVSLLREIAMALLERRY